MQGGAYIHAARGEERRGLVELPEVGIATTHVHAEVGKVTGVDRQTQFAGESDIIHHISQANVVDPQFERVVAHDAGAATGHTVHAHKADRHFLHAGEIGRRDGRVGAVHDVAILTDRITTHGHASRQARATDQLQVGARTGHRVGGAGQEIIFELRAQDLKLLQIDPHFRLPRTEPHPSVHRCAIHVEVVLVAADLHVAIQLAVLPPAVAAATHPQAQRLVAHEGLGAFLEAEEGFGAIKWAELTARDACLQPQRTLVHLQTVILVAGLPILRRFDHTRRRRVRNQRGGVERADHAGDHVAAHHTGRVAGHTRKRFNAALEPRGADQLQSGQRHAHERVVRRLGARHHREPQRAHAPVVRIVLRFSRRAPVDAHLHPAQRIADHAIHRRVLLLVALAHSRPIARIRQVDHKTLVLLLIDGRVRHVELAVEIDVFFVQPVVAGAAVGATVAEHLHDLHGLRADGNLVLRRDHRRRASAIHDHERIGHVAGQALIVLGRIKCPREPIALGVKAIKAHEALAAIGGVGGKPGAYRRVHRKRFGGEGHAVLADLAEVEYERGIALHLRLLGLHQREKFDVLGTRQIGAAGIDHRAQRAPATSGGRIANEAVVTDRPGEPALRGAGLEVEDTTGFERIERHPQQLLRCLHTAAHDAHRRIDLLETELNEVAPDIDAVVLERHRRGAVHRERATPEARAQRVPQRRTRAVVPGAFGERDPGHGAFALKRFEVRLPRGIGLRFAHRELTLQAHARRGGALLEGELPERAREQRGIPRQITGHAGYQRADRLKPKRRSVVSRALTLRDRGEGQLPVLEWELRRKTENGGGRRREQRVLLVAHRYLSGRREQRIRPIEGDHAEVVVDLVVGRLGQQAAVERHALGVGSHLNRAELDGLRAAATFGEVAGHHAIDGLRSLRRVQVLVGIAVQRVVGWIGERLRQSAARERLQRRIEHEVIADQLLLAIATGERRQRVRIVGARPHAILHVEGRRVGGLRQTKQLQIGFTARRVDRLFLVAGGAGDELELDRLTLQIFAAEAIHRLQFAQEVRGVGGLEFGLPEQIRVLRVGRELDVGRATSAHIPSRRAGHIYFVRDGEPLTVRVERTHQCNPELRGIDVVVDVLAQHFVDLPRGIARPAHRELRAARILIRGADELAIHVESRRSHGIGKRCGELLHLLPIQQVDVGIPTEQARIDGEEEASRFDLNVFDDAIDLLLRTFPDGKDVVFGDIAFLLRRDGREAHGSDLSGGLNPVVTRRDARREEARGRRLEGDVADFERLQGFVRLALVAHRDVVRRIEFTLRVVVDIHVHAIGHDAAGAHVELKVERRLKDAEAIVAKDGELRRGASLVATALHLRLEARLEGDPEVADLAHEVGGKLGGGIGPRPALRDQRHQGAGGRATVGPGGGDRRPRPSEAADDRLSPAGGDPLLVAATGDGYRAIGDAGGIRPQRRSDAKRAEDGGDLQA